MSTPPDADAQHAQKAAEHLIAIKRPGEALKLLGAASARYPQRSALHCLSAQAHLALKDYAAGLEATAQALSVHPNSEWAHRLRSILFARLNRNEEALDAALESVHCMPNAVLALLNLAECQLRAKLVTHAEATCATLKSLDSDNAEVHNLMGRIALADHQTSAAREHFQKSLSLNPEESAYHQNLGLTEMGRWRLQSAEERVRAGIRLNPASAPLQKLLRQIRRRKVSIVILILLALALAIVFTLRLLQQGLASAKIGQRTVVRYLNNYSIVSKTDHP